MYIFYCLTLFSNFYANLGFTAYYLEFIPCFFFTIKIHRQRIEILLKIYFTKDFCYFRFFVENASLIQTYILTNFFIMKTLRLTIIVLILFFIQSSVQAQNNVSKALFESDLSNAIYVEGVWSFNEGILTATEDQCIWTVDDYDNFILDLEFKTADGTNSGVIVYCSDWKNWIPHSVEIQIADDFSEQWAKADKTWQCGAIFGHLAAKESRVKKPGEWNKMRVACKNNIIHVVLNGSLVTEMDMNLWTSGKNNPDGSEIPAWLPTPFAELPTKGKIGFQGKHAGAPIWFRNITIKEL